MPNELTNSQKVFCQEYIYDWNATRAYKVAYPTVKNDATAQAASSRLLLNVIIQSYITEIQKDLEKLAGLSRLMVANEFRKIAFSSIANLHNTWITRKEFEDLTKEDKDCIQEIDTKVVKQKNWVESTPENPIYNDVEYIKVKLYDKTKALDSLCKLLGYNEAEKQELKFTGKPIKIGFEDDNDSD
jgi:phage terminase small subunit